MTHSLLHLSTISAVNPFPASSAQSHFHEISYSFPRVRHCTGDSSNCGKNAGTETVAQIGRQVIGANGVSFEVESTYYDDVGARKLTVWWTGPSDVVFEDCIDFGTDEWYGGPEQKEQYWPIQNGKLQKYSYISKEEDNAAISERYWLSSSGKYIYVHPEVPLFVDYHNVMDNHLCLIAEVAAPYSSKRTMNILKYDIWFFDNAKEAHLHAVDTYLGKPTGVPDYRMIQYPIWSTWAKYSRDIDQDNLWEYANRIADSGFPNSQFEIDDLWEVCYGSLTVDERKFPDMAQFVRDLKSIGFRVSIWIQPFINKGCDPWYSEALDKG
ncbi:Myogenesis-regulating glycosidase [Eumeta japonica]|uniref:Myogenesis-regulating glycosidase n=1 Tax=Eumeta variegata TaxID=151549 RepID=A0A4C1TXB1_EUMVA|nr:Myogenesis-regulating glycosidase [Eumeta japonica]